MSQTFCPFTGMFCKVLLTFKLKWDWLRGGDRHVFGCGCVGSFCGNLKGINNHVPPQTTQFEVRTVVYPVYNCVNHRIGDTTNCISIYSTVVLQICDSKVTATVACVFSDLVKLCCKHLLVKCWLIIIWNSNMMFKEKTLKNKAKIMQMFFLLDFPQ